MYGDLQTLLGCLLVLVFTFSTSVGLKTKSIFLFAPEDKLDEETSLSSAVPCSGHGFSFSYLSILFA